MRQLDYEFVIAQNEFTYPTQVPLDPTGYWMKIQDHPVVIQNDPVMSSQACVFTHNEFTYPTDEFTIPPYHTANLQSGVAGLPGNPLVYKLIRRTLQGFC